MTRDLRAALADRYRIERELGQGGMATVYLAHDLKHDRQVAIKVLRPDLAATMGAERFEREIRVAARLHNPHILGVLDSGEADGFLYYVMPYVEGETLRERISRGGELPVADAIRLLGEVAEALAVAHRGGVVHRDIKPENILLSGRHALVMDFGVAKAVTEASGRQQLTSAGMALGTPAYMAPEQATADPQLDHRVDIYALGVLGYEMLTGLPPFHGLTPQATLAAQVTRAPAPVTERRPGIAPMLDALIMRCLAKRPADRYQSAEELMAALELTTASGGLTPTGTQAVAAAAGAASTRRPLPTWAWVVVAVVVVAAGFGVFRALRGGVGVTTGAQSVAVLPFENVGGDSTNLGFADGIQSEILTVLTRLASLQVTSRSSVQEYRHSSKSVRQIGLELGVQTLLQGQVQRAGNQVHVTVQLVDAPSDRQVWAESYDREVTAQNIFSIQADIARNVAQALRASFSSAEAVSAQKPPTENLEALDWYHRGRDLFADRFAATGDSLIAAAFERAVELDSSFAEAWAGLAKARSWRVRSGSTTDTIPARTALDHAMRLAASASETRLAQAFYAYYARGDFDAALAHFKAVAEARPNDVEAVAGIGYIARRQRKWEEALDAERKVTILDPRNTGALADYALTNIYLGRHAQGESILRRALIVAPTSEGANSYLLASILNGRGDTAAARAIVAALPAGVTLTVREFYTAQLERYARHFDLSNAALARSPQDRPIDLPTYLIQQALNDVAAGDMARARQRADSAARIARSLADPRGVGVFATQADIHTILGIAAALRGQASEAIRNAERAIQLNPISRDAVEGVRSVDGLLTVHLLLGHRDEAIRLITAQAHEPTDLSLVPTSRTAIRLDPLYDGIRRDPRIQALLADSAAWVVR